MAVFEAKLALQGVIHDLYSHISWSAIVAGCRQDPAGRGWWLFQLTTKTRGSVGLNLATSSLQFTDAPL